MKYRDVLYKWNYASVMTDQQKWSKVSLMARLDMGWSLVDVDSDLVGTWPAPKDSQLGSWSDGKTRNTYMKISMNAILRSYMICQWYSVYLYIFTHTHIYIYIPIVDLQSYCWGTQRASGSQRNSSLKRKFPVPKKHEFFQDDLCLSSKQLWKHWLTFHSWEITKWLYPLNDATNMYIYTPLKQL